MERNVNPRMLILARESRNWSQKELADAISVTQGKISKYEKGVARVTDEDLKEIANVLNYTTEFFYQQDHVIGLGSSYLFNRKRKRAPIHVQKKIQAQVNILRIQAARLLEGVDLEFINSFDAVDVNSIDGDPEQAASMLRAAWRIPMGPIDNLTAIVEGAGGVVMKCDFDTPLIDATHFWPVGMPPMFFMNKDVTGDRFRFTLAHEVGHAILHRSHISSDIEEEADQFASEFLMPRREIDMHLHGLTLERAASLKQDWKVSMASIIRRAYDLGRISDWKYKSLNISLSAQGYRTQEPFPLEPEEPSLMRDIVKAHRNELGYDDTELASLLYITDPQFFAPGEAPRIHRLNGKPFYVFATPKSAAIPFGPITQAQ